MAPPAVNAPLTDLPHRCPLGTALSLRQRLRAMLAAADPTSARSIANDQAARKHPASASLFARRWRVNLQDAGQGRALGDGLVGRA
jgi:hypothetical protein